MVLETSKGRNRVHNEHVKLIWIRAKGSCFQIISFCISEELFDILEEFNKLRVKNRIPAVSQLELADVVG